ncbi:MFS transporter [Taibaiella helva]|uniref:MFS transporter n=1 Tax=Taibaiella helva TaxID=2301235 RepID=UPI000E57E640|nr:MFS transporter [Taibaiella helva]
MTNLSTEQQPSAKKLHRAWSMYDWANSAYNLVITSTIFPAYYIAITTSGGKEQDYVSFFGWRVINSSLLNYALALAYLIIAFLSPVLSSIADYKGNKKKFMQLFCYLGAAACCGLFFFEKGNIELGIILSILAAVGYCGSLVFYNAYLPEIAAPEDQDRVSAQGFSYGYIGSVLLQIICLAFVFTLSDGGLSARISFLLVGLWWIGFSQITFRTLPVRQGGVEKRPDHSLLSNGFHELRKVWEQIKTMPLLKTFLAAFFFYSMGVQTVMLAAAEFGKKEIYKIENGVKVPMATSDLIVTILLIQLVAIGGAMLMARLSKAIGNIKVLMLTVLLWIAICVIAYYTRTAMQFYLLAVLVGLVMGGIQSISRSTYSKLMPETKDTASFFSFYDVTEKIAIVIGMFSFGFIEHMTGNMRNSIFALTIFFLLGFIFLLRAGIKGKQSAAFKRI